MRYFLGKTLLNNYLWGAETAVRSMLFSCNEGDIISASIYEKLILMISK